MFGTTSRTLLGPAAKELDADASDAAPSVFGFGLSGVCREAPGATRAFKLRDIRPDVVDFAFSFFAFCLASSRWMCCFKAGIVSALKTRGEMPKDIASHLNRRSSPVIP